MLGFISALRSSNMKKVSVMKMSMAGGLFLVVGMWGLGGPVSMAANPPTVQTVPAPGTTYGGNGSGTIASTGTFQEIFAAATPGSDVFRRGCLIENLGSHNMYVNEATVTPTESNTFALPGIPTTGAVSVFHCDQPGGTVWTGEIDITGTASDAFYAVQW